jgi:hypothetical protein
MFRRVAWFAILAGTLLASPVGAQVQLAWKFQVGDRFYLEETVKNEMSFVVVTNGNPQNPMKLQQTQTNKRVSEFVVKEVDKDGYVLEQKILRWIDAKTGGPGPDTDTQLDKIVGNSVFTVRITHLGTVVKFDGYDNFMKQLKEASPGEAKFLMDALTRDALRSPIVLAFDLLSRREVTKGDRWMKTVGIPLGPLGNSRIENEFTYHGQAGGLEELAIKGTFTYQPPREDVDAGPVKILKLNLKSPGTNGKASFDRNAGRLVRLEVTTPINGIMVMEGGGNQIDMTLEGIETRTVRMLKTNPLSDAK